MPPWSPYPPCRLALLPRTVAPTIYIRVLVIGPAVEVGCDHPYAAPDHMLIVEDITTGRRELAAASVLR